MLLFSVLQSYAGKYVPAIAYRVLNQAEQLVPLTGVAIGDGFSDPPVVSLPFLL